VKYYIHLACIEKFNEHDALFWMMIMGGKHAIYSVGGQHFWCQVLLLLWNKQN